MGVLGDVRVVRRLGRKDNLGERRSCSYSIVWVRWGVLERGDRGSLGVGGPPGS